MDTKTPASQRAYYASAHHGAPVVGGVLERHAHLTPLRQTESQVVTSLYNTFDAMQFGDSLRLAPRRLLAAIGQLREQFAVTGGQQDAAEWMFAVVDATDEATRTEAPVMGLLRVGECGGDDVEKVTVEPPHGRADR
jgi:hypothetical protein